MKKIWFACDSFKGSCSSEEIAKILADETQACFPQVQTHCLTISDGGEGLVNAVIALDGFEQIDCPSVDPWFRPIMASYARHDKIAVIELAQCSGLSLCHPLDPSMTSTYGTGLQIQHAIKQGCTTIYIGLGGSGTHDGAAGIAHALNAHFYNQSEECFCPTGATLSQITKLDCTDLEVTIKGCQFYLLSDVKNPAWGTQGAAAIFAKQKGANQQMIQHLETNTLAYCQQLTATTGIDYSQMEGAGAAGACGVGLLSLLHAQSFSGLDCLLQWSKFDQQIQDANLIVTGEGKLDQQSLQGKVVYGILQRGQRYHIPVVALCGCLELPYTTCLDHGFYDVVVINPKTLSLEECLATVTTQLRLSWHDWLIAHQKVLFEDDVSSSSC